MGPVVIGAGIAGLTAAYDLVKAGLKPTVIEPGRIGGMISTEVRDGFTLECGPNVLVERPDLEALVAELGLSDRVRYPCIAAYRQYVWYRGAPVMVPKALPAFVRSSLFSAFVKLALPVKLLRQGVLTPRSDDESVLQFFSRLIGEDAVRVVLDPVLKGIYGGDVERLSARSLFPGLWSAACRGESLLQYLRSRRGRGAPPICVIEGGNQVLADALWRRIEPQARLVKAHARLIRPSEAGAYSIDCSDGLTIETSHVVCTAAGVNLASLLRHMSPETSSRVERVEYASLVVSHSWIPRSQALPRDGFGVLFSGGMPLHLLGVMFNSLIFPHVAPPDKHILTAVLGGAQAGGGEINTAEIEKELPALLERYLGVEGVRPLRSTAWKGAIPQLNIGHHAVVEALDRFEATHPGVIIAGVDRGAVGVSDRIRLGREAARRVLENSPDIAGERLPAVEA